MEKAAFGKLKVLVADQPYMANLVAGMLRALGVKSVTEVNDSTAVLQALQRGPFDVVLIDDALGPVDTIKAMRELRGDDHNANRHIPVLMMFAVADKARVIAARDAGVTEFLIKPLSAQIIGLRLTQTLLNPRPFVAAPEYVGPDRRRKAASVKGPERRKRQPAS